MSPYRCLWWCHYSSNLHWLSDPPPRSRSHSNWVIPWGRSKPQQTPCPAVWSPCRWVAQLLQGKPLPLLWEARAFPCYLSTKWGCCCYWWSLPLLRPPLPSTVLCLFVDWKVPWRHSDFLLTIHHADTGLPISSIHLEQSSCCMVTWGNN